MDSINVFIARSFSQHSEDIEEIISSWTKNYNIIPVDSKLRPDKDINFVTDLSIILCRAHTCNRECVNSWLDRISLKIKDNSKYVLVLLYADANEIDLNVLSYTTTCRCIRETTDDEYNLSIIKKHILDYKSFVHDPFI